MTEKRFTLAYEKGNWWAVKDRDITLWKEEVIYLLNELHEENQELRERIKDLRIGVLDSIREADEIQCTCNPCVVEECIMKKL